MSLRVTIRFRIVEEINQVSQKVPSSSSKTYFTITCGSSPKYLSLFLVFLFHCFIFHRISCVDFFHGATALSGPGFPNYRGFAITVRHTTLIRTPLYEWTSRHRGLYVTHNTHKRQTTMSTAGFELAFSASKPLSTHALNRAAAALGPLWMLFT